MADLYIVTGTTTNGNGTEEVILERDDETGEVTKSVSKTHPAELTKADVEVCESLGVVVEKVSKSDAEEIESEANQQVGTDTAGAAPVFDQSPQATEKDGGRVGEKSGDKAGK